MRVKYSPLFLAKVKRVDVRIYKSLRGKIAMIVRYNKGEEPDKEKTVKYAHFTLLGEEFGAMG